MNPIPRLALILTAAAPLLLVVRDATHGWAMGALAAVALYVCGLLVNLSHHFISPTMRFSLLPIAASGVVSALAILLAASAWETHQALHTALPFLLFNGLAFTCLEQDCLARPLGEMVRRLLLPALVLLVACGLYGTLRGALGGTLSPDSVLTRPAGILFMLAAILAIAQFAVQTHPSAQTDNEPLP